MSEENPLWGAPRMDEYGALLSSHYLLHDRTRSSPGRSGLSLPQAKLNQWRRLRRTRTRTRT
jgi:hypothetical protein